MIGRAEKPQFIFAGRFPNCFDVIEHAPRDFHLEGFTLVFIAQLNPFPPQGRINIKDVELGRKLRLPDKGCVSLTVVKPLKSKIQNLKSNTSLSSPPEFSS